MSNTPDEIWKSVAPHLQRRFGLHRPSIKEAQADFDAAEDEPLSVEQLRSIAAFAKGKAPAPKPERKPSWHQGITSALSGPQLIPAFNRNAGEDDDSVEKLMDQLRREALSESDEGTEEDMDSAPSAEDK